jgi:hypothetical protein
LAAGGACLDVLVGEWCVPHVEVLLEVEVEELED